jgi:hypothetical protein
MNGFLTTFDIDTGGIIDTVRLVDFQDVRIYGACHDDQSLYVAGTKQGSAFAYVAKFDNIDALDTPPIWSQQMKVTTTVDQVKCAITNDGAVLYVAGTVTDGGNMIDAGNSAGGDDIFVAQLSSVSGDINWRKQIGTSGDERLGSLAVDDSGNAILYGDTTGSMYREKNGSFADLFLFSVSRLNGEYEPLNQPSPTDGKPPASEPPAAGQDQNVGSNPGESIGIGIGIGNGQAQVPSSFGDTNTNNRFSACRLVIDFLVDSAHYKRKHSSIRALHKRLQGLLGTFNCELLCEYLFANFNVILSHGRVKGILSITKSVFCH